MRIHRELLNVITNQQKEEAKLQLAERYADFAEVRNGRNILFKEGEARYIWDSMGSAGFSLVYERGSNILNKLKMHPQCGGTAKVKLD